jgi:hypothetical protein
MPDGCACHIAQEGDLGQAYNEEAFRYFLAIERKRGERSGRPFVLLLVNLKQESGRSARIDPAVAREIFSGLWTSLRETDFIGWYWEDHVAGALLVEFQGGTWRDVSSMIVQKVNAGIRERLSTTDALRLQVRAREERFKPPHSAGARLSQGDI